MNKIQYILLASMSFTLLSCEDFLDKEPESKISPENYFANSSQLQAYLDGQYPNILLTHSNAGNNYGIYGVDAGTDNQIGPSANVRYADGLWKVPNSEKSDWNFANIYNINFFLSNALSRYGNAEDGSENRIDGTLSTIKHLIGEGYFLRAYEYYRHYWKIGDFPIITEPLNDNWTELTEASRRMPRNEVARFILSDLEHASAMMDGSDMPTTRINRDAALLLKSRVALYEATWLKYFKGTPFVPCGKDWPGYSKEYNAGYAYPSGDIDSEIDYFLGVAMEASKAVAENYKNRLTENTGYVQQSAADDKNPYHEMFASSDLSSFPEVLLWRQYARSKVTHPVDIAGNQGNNRIGVTRGLVNSYLMADGTPVYTNGTYADGNGYYMGDKTIHDVRQNRDSRLVVFLKEPNQVNIIYENPEGTEAWMSEPYPNITSVDNQRGYMTGYALRKGSSFDQANYLNMNSFSASICFRATEALLNYIEACYEKNGALDNLSKDYWSIVRQRSHVDTDFEKTISLTQMNKEAENDWGAYSGGTLVDATLYNIRRERRCEMLAEGLRYEDLCRWRSMDQMISQPYFVEGIHLWGTPMEAWYTDLLADGSSDATVSSSSLSEYLRPYQKNSTQICYDGLKWHKAHYLSPIMYKEFLLTSPSGNDPDKSPIYQNPYWPLATDQSAME